MAKGLDGRLTLHNFHAAMGRCGARTTYAFTHSGSLGVPIEFNDVTSITSGPIVIGSAGNSGCVTRRAVPRASTPVNAYDQHGDLVMHEGNETTPTSAPTPASTADAPSPTATPPAPAPAAPTASSTTRTPPKNTVDRLHALGDDAKIKFRQPCPKQQGTASAARYEEYMTCSALDEYLWPTRARRADYPCDYDAGYLTFENPTVITFVGSIWSELLLPPTPDLVHHDEELAYVNEYFGAHGDIETTADTGRPTPLLCCDTIEYFDSAWDWSLNGSTARLSAGTPVSSLLYINKWGGGEPDGYTNNYIDYTNGVQHEMDTLGTIDDTMNMDTAYISARVDSLGTRNERALPTPPPGYIGTWEACMDEASEYDNDNTVNGIASDDITARCETMKIAAAQIITDINGAGPEEYIELTPSWHQAGAKLALAPSWLQAAPKCVSISLPAYQSIRLSAYQYIHLSIPWFQQHSNAARQDLLSYIPSYIPSYLPSAPIGPRRSLSVNPYRSILIPIDLDKQYRQATPSILCNGDTIVHGTSTQLPDVSSLHINAHDATDNPGITNLAAQLQYSTITKRVYDTRTYGQLTHARIYHISNYHPVFRSIDASIDQPIYIGTWGGIE